MVDMRSVAPEEAALLDVTQRLARQVEQQLTQLRRMRDRTALDGGAADAGLGDIEHTVRRMQHHTARLQLLCGAGPLPGASADPRTVADVLADAAAGTAHPDRLTVRPAPVATIEPRAAAELAHVLAEVVDGALAESGPGVTVGGRLGPAGLTVDVLADGPRRPRGVTERVAEALARRSACGIQVHRGLDGPYAIVLCPSAALTVPLQRRAEPVRTPAVQEFGLAAPRRSARSPEPDLFGVRAGGSAGGADLFGSSRSNGSGYVPPVAGPPAAFGADPLFGPLPTPDRLDDAMATPIFEAVASAWFREDGFAGDPAQVAEEATPGDLEWRAAAARAARADDEDAGVTTASGLPRRRPGRQMVTPPLQRAGAPAGRERRGAHSDERAPERVRHRLDDYQRGLREGRHRAV